MYVNSIRDGRFGDAVWVRYHIYGDVENGMVGGSNNMTILDVRNEDALSYRVHSLEESFKALLFHAKASSADGPADVIEVNNNLDERIIAQFKAQEEAQLENEAGM
ncbi:uncharacterized protein N7496_010863 [Penicillium cataractarum]|uniref:Uncharacterized protein n=1 Tax=Penicillium cataractarum TaxID=2100454 RepID=A0A9W9UX34_9EURO|nr:uncharacterized protein N7496_010863 [Penicillium cataractarum]KAJ5358450.1 hypothetical protein N7496_010863 [Penicillium cataractarum]